MQGERRVEGYSESFLKKFGVTEGSTIVMTESAFMTTEAWLAIVPSMIRGMRQLNIYVEKTHSGGLWRYLTALEHTHCRPQLCSFVLIAKSYL